MRDKTRFLLFVVVAFVSGQVGATLFAQTQTKPSVNKSLVRFCTELRKDRKRAYAELGLPADSVINVGPIYQFDFRFGNVPTGIYVENQDDAPQQELNQLIAVLAERRWPITAYQGVYKKLGPEHFAKLAKRVPIYGLVLGECNLEARDLRLLANLKELRSLTLYEANLTDRDVEQHISRLGKLRELALSANKLTDASIKSLASLPDLEDLQLWGNTMIGTDGFKLPAGFANLRRLSLEFTSVDDRAMQAIARLPNLRMLDIRFTKVTDAGLARLSDSKSLGVLLVSESAATKRGIRHLQRLPFLHTVFTGNRQEIRELLPLVGTLQIENNQLGITTDFEYVDTPLADVLEGLVNKHEMKLDVDEAVLNRAGIDVKTPVNFKFRGELGTGLRWALAELDLGLIAKQDRVTVTTRTAAEQHREVRHYDLDQTFGPTVDADQLTTLVRESVYSETWADPVHPTSIVLSGSHLIVKHNQFVHRAVRDLLESFHRGWRIPDSQWELWALLEETMDYESGTPLGDFADFLRELTGTPFVLDRPALEKAGIRTSKPLEFDDTKPQSLEEVIDLMFKPVGLDWVATDGAVLITTPEHIGKYTVTFAHDLESYRRPDRAPRVLAGQIMGEMRQVARLKGYAWRGRVFMNRVVATTTMRGHRDTRNAIRALAD